MIWRGGRDWRVANDLELWVCCYLSFMLWMILGGCGGGIADSCCYSILNNIGDIEWSFFLKRQEENYFDRRI